MTAEDTLAVNGNGDLIYPFPSTNFNSYLNHAATADSSQHNSPRFIQRTASPAAVVAYQHIYSNDISSSPSHAPLGISNPNGVPAPPPYPPHLSTVMPIRTRSPLVQPRILTANLHTAPPTMAPPPAPTSSLSNMKNKRSSARSQGGQGPKGPQDAPFYALVKAGPDSNSELYARPPSDHFYFKINDGKTEFI